MRNKKGRNAAAHHKPSDQQVPDSSPAANGDPRPELEAAADLVRIECQHSFTELQLGKYDDAMIRITNLCEKYKNSPHAALVHVALVNILIKMASVTDSPCDNRDTLKEAAMTAISALRFSPSSIALPSLFAYVSYEMASEEKEYEEVVEECERALAVENPVDPGEESMLEMNQNKITTAESRIASTQRDLRGFLQMSNIASISSWMKNLRHGEHKFRLYSIPRTSDEINKATKTPEERMKEIELSIAAERRDRISTYWNSMSSDMKKDFLRVKISDLKAHFSALKDVLDEALSFGEANKVWKVLMCFPCNERFADADSFMCHVGLKHTGRILPMMESVLPQIVENEWAKMLLTCSWNPLELNDTMRILKENSKPKAPDPNDSCIKKSLLQRPWPLSNDPERVTLLGKIRDVIHDLIEHKYLASSHLRKVIQFAGEVLRGLEGGPLLIGSEMDQTPLCIHLLDASELDKILKYLEEISKACGLSTCPDESNVTGVSESGVERVDIIERVTFSQDCSFLVLDENFLPCKTPSSSCNEAVSCDSSSATSSHITDDNDALLDSDALLSWLFTGPSSEEKLASWTSMREVKSQQGQQTLQLLEKKFHCLKGFVEKKRDHLGYKEALQAVERLPFRTEMQRTDETDFASRSYESVLRDRREELIKNANLIAITSKGLELVAVLTVLNDTQNVNKTGLKETHCSLISHLCALESGEIDNGRTNVYLQKVDSCIQVAMQRQKEQVSLQLDQTDAMIMLAIKEMQHVEDKLKTTSSQDYRSILIPLVKSFLLARLEDLAEKDATEKSDAAKKALIAELALYSKRSVNAGVDHSKHVNGSTKKNKSSNENGENRDLKMEESDNKLGGMLENPANPTLLGTDTGAKPLRQHQAEDDSEERSQDDDEQAAALLVLMKSNCHLRDRESFHKL